MRGFELDPAALGAVRRRAAALAESNAVLEVLGRLDRPDRSDEELAALLLSTRVDGEALVDAARSRAPAGHPAIETFSPLYLSNECDAECAMCGMRSGNDRLRRETADAATVEAQLDILHRRGLRGVALLTGEYRHGERRRRMLARTADALRAALERGFEHVLVNVGAIEDDEYPALLAGVPRRADGRVAPRVTMCTFQETYDPATYARFMGTRAANPRSDFARRLGNFDRAREAGLWSANPGVLLGLNADLAYEFLAVLAHVRHLESQGMSVYVSVPRLRKASGAPRSGGVSDDELVRLVALLAIAAPDAKVVVSTREPPAIQRRLLPLIGVLTPGSPGVAPYTDSDARFEVDASQFEVLDHRPIEVILGDILATGATIDCYEPSASA